MFNYGSSAASVSREQDRPQAPESWMFSPVPIQQLGNTL